MTISELDDDIDFLCGSTSATYLVADKRRNMNIAYRNVATVIWESDGGWHYDDRNTTSLPQATTDLVHNQQDYTIPTTAFGIHRIEIKDANGNWIKVNPLDSSEIRDSIQEYLGGSGGTPLYYELVGHSIFLYPIPTSGSVTTTNGLKAYMDRDINEIAVTATSLAPGFPEPYHRILSYACSIDFVADDKHRQFLVEQKDRLEQGMRRYYAKRADELRTKIKPRGRRYWHKYT